jgi:hypothetical protein
VTGTNHQTRRGSRLGQVATLVRSVPIRLVEISRGGCRLECPRHLESGTSGLLVVELAGVLQVDDIRIARCQQKVGAGSVFQIGAELLRTRRLGRRTIRMAIGRILGTQQDAVHARLGPEAVFPRDIRRREAGDRFDGRAPPDTLDRGS